MRVLVRSTEVDPIWCLSPRLSVLSLRDTDPIHCLVCVSLRRGYLAAVLGVSRCLQALSPGRRRRSRLPLFIMRLSRAARPFVRLRSLFISHCFVSFCLTCPDRLRIPSL